MATVDDQESIQSLQTTLNRPRRTDSEPSEYFVALNADQVVGCGAVRSRRETGYLYGLAVEKAWRRHGIGHALTDVRLGWLREQKAQSAFVMAMFWNVRFFRKHNFILIDRKIAGNLEWLHGDFRDGWSSRSALLHIETL